MKKIREFCEAHADTRGIKAPRTRPPQEKNPKEKSMKLMSKTLFPCLFAIGCAAVMTTNAKASVIYFDNFSGNIADNLGGTAPDTRPGTETWVSDADSIWKADGTFNSPSVGNAGSTGSFLPFTATTGNIYTLTLLNVDVTSLGTGNSNRHIGFGFANISSNTYEIFNNSSTNGPSVVFAQSYYIQYQGNNYENTVATNPGTHIGETGDWVVDLRMVLDTRDSLWSVSYYTRDSSAENWGLGGSFTYASNPTFTHVGITGRETGETGTANIGSFELAVIPEPHAALLGGLGLFLLIRRRR